MPWADEMPVFAFQRSAEVKAHIGRGPVGVFGPIDMNFTSEEWNQNAPFERNIRQVAEFMFHKSLSFICICI